MYVLADIQPIKMLRVVHKETFMHKEEFLVVFWFCFKNVRLYHFILKLLILLNESHHLELFTHGIAGDKGLVVKVVTYNHWHSFFFLNMRGL